MADFHIREATEGDARGMAKVRVDTWRATYKGIVPDDYLESLSDQEISERWKKTFWENRDPNIAVFVAESGQKEIVGIAVCGPERNNDPVYQGEIYVLYVLPQYQHQDIGRGLVSTCVHYLTQQLHMETMLIWVIEANPYRKFYESLGGKLVREKTIEIGGSLILEVGYGWEEIHNMQNRLDPSKHH